MFGAADRLLRPRDIGWRRAVLEIALGAQQVDLLGHAIAEQPATTREAIAVALDRLSRR